MPRNSGEREEFRIESGEFPAPPPRSLNQTQLVTFSNLSQRLAKGKIQERAEGAVDLSHTSRDFSSNAVCCLYGVPIVVI